MEVDDHSLLEEFFSLRRDTWENFPTEMSEFYFNGGGTCDYQEENQSFVLPNSSFQGFATEPAFDCLMNEVQCSYGDEFLLPETEIDSSSNRPDKAPEDGRFVRNNDDELGLLVQNSEVGRQMNCKVELGQSSENAVFDMGFCLNRKNRGKKVEGQPSKNLMAERRRRKRLNDRLSMLRSVVPIISKMDRTSILGDTINYMKELLERIKNMKEESTVDSNQLNLLAIFKELKPNETLARNSPKFEVERRDKDTRIEICCPSKPGLLLSTVTTLEALGLEIQQCVISCFNDFGMQASCSEEMKQRTTVSTEEIKQALLRNAGYGGRSI